MTEASTTTIYTARRIITMNSSLPSADAVAVRDGRILAVGSLDEVTSWDADAVVDETFADKVLTPGFIEAHSHVMAGGMWTRPYVGFFDRRDPEGKVWDGLTTFDAVIDRLVEAEAELSASGAEANDPLVAWGLDPIYFDGERLLAHHLDRVSENRPILIFHASGHLVTVNSAMLRRHDIDADSPTPGVDRDADGNPNGELQEPAAMALARSGMAKLGSRLRTEEAMWNYAAESRNAGHTLITDLGTSQLTDPDQLERWTRIVNDEAYPCRTVVALSSVFGGPTDPQVWTEFAKTLPEHTTDKLHFGVVKLMLDGSIQGFTARVSWPHYYNPPEGHPGNGLWLTAPEQFASVLEVYHRAGLTVHVHCNGDEATEVFLDAMEQVLTDYPRPDHRHTVQHCQLTKPHQYRRMAKLGMCANIFANHLFYWGDQHRELTLGPERAAGMDACATALQAGVPMSIHSDAPVTPMGHLHTAWCAVNRVTASGQVLGPDERISAHEALAAITLGAAYQLKLDHEIGSIEAGKLADFAVLDDDPLEVDPMAIKDIGVWGTVLGGVPFPAARG